MQEPEWPPVCECRYDEVHDRMDREDCCFHCDMEEEISEPQERQITLKKPAAMAGRDEENAA
jgi:hypothetical protein